MEFYSKASVANHRPISSSDFKDALSGGLSVRPVWEEEDSRIPYEILDLSPIAHFGIPVRNTGLNKLYTVMELIVLRSGKGALLGEGCPHRATAFYSDPAPGILMIVVYERHVVCQRSMFYYSFPSTRCDEQLWTINSEIP